MLNIPNRNVLRVESSKDNKKEDCNMQILNLQDIFTITDELYLYLENKDIDFDEDGFPIFREEMFLKEWPELVIPYAQRKNRRVTNPKKTLLCFFDKDHKLYPRLGKVLDEINEYKNYMGAVGLDVTITEDMDDEWQTAIFLLNQLFLAVLAVNDIKIVINTRSAGLDLGHAFRNYPQQVMAASGFLGCDGIKEERDYLYLEKILSIMPSKLILYGKRDKRAEEQLLTMGIDYRVYTDFHRLCKEVHHGR